MKRDPPEIQVSLRGLVRSVTHGLREELGLNENSRVGARQETGEEE